MKHKDKVIFVTGAGQGMGLAMVKLFAEQGAKVAAIDINEAAAKKVAEQQNAESGTEVIGIGCDISQSSSVRDAITEVVQRLGSIDVVINNAGIGSIDSFIDTPDENWHKVINVNLTGTFYCCREAARVMKEQGSGCIINISSTAVMSGDGPSHYCASKAGVIGLTRSIAKELAASGIRVNTIVPGPTNTPMMADIPEEWTQQMIDAIPLGRMGEPADIAKLASFIASDDASFITGQNLAVNGGMAFL